jgi:glycosyltransferase involved in cell wall biosynthesis
VRAVAEKLRQEHVLEFDLVDVHWTYPDIVAGYLLARKAGKKFSVTVRGHEALYQEERTLRRWLVAHFLRKADMVVTLSAELRDRVVALGVDPNKARVVLNGVDLASFHPLDRVACRRQLGLPMEKKILLSVGRLTQGKGHQELVRIMPEISKTMDAELYIIGGMNPEEDFGQVLRTMISELALNNVHLVDKVAHEMLPFWYSAADLFCLATQREGCPNVLLEALACGTPAVVTDVGAVAALVTHGENGFLVHPEQISYLGGIVRSALNCNWNREQIASRMNEWEWSNCARQVVEVYQSVLEQGESKV